MSNTNGHLPTPEEFVLLAVQKLTPQGKKGFIPSWGAKGEASFNKVFKELFREVDPKELCHRLAAEGKIVILPMRGRNGASFVLLCPAGTETPEQRTVRYAAKKAEYEVKKVEKARALLDKLGLR